MLLEQLKLFKQENYLIKTLFDVVLPDEQHSAV